MPEVHWDTQLSGRWTRFLLLFDQSGSAKVQFQHLPGLSVFSVGRSREDFWRRHLNFSSLYFHCLHGQMHLSIQPLDCPSAVLISLWLVCALEMEHWMQMTEWFPNPGSPHPSPCGWRPCLGTNHCLYWFPLLPCWNVQHELFTPLLELTSHESKSWHCRFPQTLERFSLHLLCFHRLEFYGYYLHLPLSVRHH